MEHKHTTTNEAATKNTINMKRAHIREAGNLVIHFMLREPTLCSSVAFKFSATTNGGLLRRSKKGSPGSDQRNSDQGFVASDFREGLRGVCIM